MSKTWAVMRAGVVLQRISSVINPNPSQFQGCEIYECDETGAPIDANGAHVPTVQPGADKAAEARVTRDNALRATDWTQLADVPASTQNLWRAYRQALRDLPQQANFPDSITWPTPPA